MSPRDIIALILGGGVKDRDIDKGTDSKANPVYTLNFHSLYFMRTVFWTPPSPGCVCVDCSVGADEGGCHLGLNVAMCSV